MWLLCTTALTFLLVWSFFANLFDIRNCLGGDTGEKREEIESCLFMSMLQKYLQELSTRSVKKVICIEVGNLGSSES